MAYYGRNLAPPGHEERVGGLDVLDEPLATDDGTPAVFLSGNGKVIVEVMNDVVTRFVEWQ